MIRRSSAALVALVLMLVGAVGLAGVPSARAQQAPDKSDVVILLDFSASILQDKANRQRFATALDRIADRVDAISPDLEAGDGTLSLVQFAARARDYPGCTDLKTLGSPRNRREVRGLPARASPGPTARASTRTSASGSASTRTTWPRWSRRLAICRRTPSRPAVVLLTDGKHDVAGVPGAGSVPRATACSATSSPFALLPVGMGLDGGRTWRAQARPRRAEGHPRHAGVRQRLDVRLAADVVQLRGLGGQRGRARPPERHLHVHGRAHAHAAPDADADARAAAGPGPEHRGGRGKRRDPAHLAGARRRTGRRRRLRRPLPHGPGRLDRYRPKGHRPRRTRPSPVSTTARRTSARSPRSGARPRKAGSRKPRSPSRPSAGRRRRTSRPGRSSAAVSG